jgi:hypothetical protein
MVHPPRRIEHFPASACSFLFTFSLGSFDGIFCARKKSGSFICD